jgi:hypothetical protein
MSMITTLKKLTGFLFACIKKLNINEVSLHYVCI